MAPFSRPSGLNVDVLVQEVVVRVAVDQRGDADGHQTLHGIGAVDVAVIERDGRFLVFGQVLAQSGRGQRARQRERGGDALGLDVHVLAEGRDGRGVEPFGKRLVVDVGDVVDAEAALPLAV